MRDFSAVSAPFASHCGMAALALLLMASHTMAQSAPLSAGMQHVALGSSFAAGPGIPQQAATCGRSDHNYPHLVAASLGLVLTDVSCSGATTGHILDTPQGEAPPQLSALQAETALVTLTIGGNDISYSSSTGRCAGAKAEDRCTDKLDKAAIAQVAGKLTLRLGQVIDAIRARSPRAIIVMVPYPRVIPDQAQRCAAVGLVDADADYLATLGQQLEDAMVGTANAHGALVADVYVDSDDHGPCADEANRWVNGAVPAGSGTSFHPTARGHEAMAAKVRQVLEQQ